MAEKKLNAGTAKKMTAARQSRVSGTIKRTLSKKTGPQNNGREIEFSFYAPLATQVCVGGSFNGWHPHSFPLKKSSSGQWKGTIRLEPGRYEYRYLVDANWENDQKSCELAQNEYGSTNCILMVQ